MNVELLNLVGKSYKKEGKTYFVEGVDIKGRNVLVQTDLKAVVVDNTQYSINDFLSKIEILSEGEVKKSFVPNGNMIIPQRHVYPAEVVVAMSHSEKMSTSLMAIFENLSENPSEEMYKKAKSLIDVANAVVNIQTAQIKFLTLKR